MNDQTFEGKHLVLTSFPTGIFNELSRRLAGKGTISVRTMFTPDTDLVVRFNNRATRAVQQAEQRGLPVWTYEQLLEALQSSESDSPKTNPVPSEPGSEPDSPKSDAGPSSLSAGDVALGIAGAAAVGYGLYKLFEKLTVNDDGRDRCSRCGTRGRRLTSPAWYVAPGSGLELLCDRCCLRR